MSLINDALKKAQRQRAEPAPGGHPPAGAAPTARVEKRGQPMRAQSLILIVAGATVLIVISVVITVYFLNRPSPPAHVIAPTAKTPTVLPDKASPPVVVSGVSLPPAAGKTAPVTAPDESAAAPKNHSAATAAGSATELPAPKPIYSATPSATSPEPRTGGPSAPAGVPDVRVQIFVDSIRVMGIRSSGGDSKVLMNDRVYHVNDIVDRALGITLVKVASDTLTFTDPNGVTYTKIF